MDPFLLQVVKTILTNKIDLVDYIFVLPNQRAGVYLKKHLKDTITKTSFLPDTITFDKFAEQLAGIPKISTVELLFDFYTIYKRKTPKNTIDSFETFSQWASIILNDINDIDAFLVNPTDIFETLKNINTLQNWSPDTILTKNYLSFLQNLKTYYIDLKELLLSKQKAYQGLLFKEAVKAIPFFIENTDKKIVFIGFNDLNTSEIQIIQELLAADKAEIYFDLQKSLVKTNAGHFINTYHSSWNYFKKNKIRWINNNHINSTNIEIIGVSKNVGMLKYAGELLKNKEKIDETALILADQSILPIALNAIPIEIENINITMGTSLKQVPFSNLINALFELHTQNPSDEKYYHKTLFKIIQHPIIQTNINGSHSLYKNLISQNRVYIDYNDIIKSGSQLTAPEKEIINVVFSPIKNNDITNMLLKIKKLIDFLKNKVSIFDREILYQHYQLNQQLKSLTSQYNYVTTIGSLFQIYKRLLITEKISFIGEPLQGLQIMGFLETQAIDFKHIIITSLNEGILPKGKTSNSFIPFDVRKHYGLPTYQEEDAIANYHFYRLLQRAEKISLLYNIQTEAFGGGEKSRFLTQLIWDFPEIKHKVIHTNVPNDSLTLKTISKTQEILLKLKELAKKGISPSALALYLYNPIAFYYQKVLGIKEHTGIEENVESNTMGTIIHNTLEKLYTPFIGKILDVESLQNTLKNIKPQVIQEFEDAYQNGQFNQGKNKLIFEVVVNYITRFIKNEIRELKQGKQIKILALEKELKYEMHFPKFNHPILFRGFVDRIDEVNGIIRVVDYKSGMVQPGDLKLNDFSKITIDYKYSKALQVLLYAYLYIQNTSFDYTKELQAGIYSFKNLKANFMPINFADGRKKDYSVTPEHIELFLENIQSLLLEIFDENIPFTEKEPS